MITFGGLGLLGQWLGAGGTGAAAVAAVVAVAAAIGEARGVRIVPQVRRQVPESWRRVLPVPLAAGLYGVLLGLGFTTFILTFAVWALAAVSVALGDPALGAVLGLAFGAGRALPVIALAPVAETDRGNAAHAAMAERPAILRGLRVADAVALAACAVAMTAVAPASAATIAAFSASGPCGRGRATSPSSAPARPAPATSAARAGPSACPAATPRSAPASSAGATPESQIVLARPDTLAPVASYAAPGAGPFAFSDQWVVWLVGQTQLVVQPRDASRRRRARSRPRAPASSSAARRSSARPSLFHRAGKAGSSIRLFDLATGRESVVRSERRALLSNPSFDGRRMLYVRSTYTRQELRLGPLVRRAHDAATSALYRTTPTARRDAEPRAGPPPPLRRLQGRQAAAAGAPPAGGRGRHAVDDRAWARRRVRDAAAEEEWRDDRDGVERSALTNVNCVWVGNGFRGAEAAVSLLSAGTSVDRGTFGRMDERPSTRSTSRARDAGSDRTPSLPSRR